MINDRPTRLIVNLDALLRNYEKLNNLGDKKVGLAIVKANSYGLGSKVISKLLYENGVRHFAVATFEEALELKEVIKESLILVLGVTNPKNVKYAVENNISLTCPSKEWLEEAIKELDSITGKLKVHVKIETGMNRIGTFEEKEILEIDELLDYPKVEFEGVFSHYSNADGENNDYDDYQTANFNRLVALFKHKPRYVHIENSAGTVKYNDKGTKVGYGISYETSEDEYIATVPIGYADGLLRRAQGFKLNVAGEECEIVGRVCMDQLMVRCSEKIKVGDDVLVFGEYNNQKISVDEFADYQKTISYEIFCCINQRVPRKYYLNNTEL